MMQNVIIATAACCFALLCCCCNRGPRVEASRGSPVPITFTLYGSGATTTLSPRAAESFRRVIAREPAHVKNEGGPAPLGEFNCDGRKYVLFAGTVTQDFPRSGNEMYFWQDEIFAKMLNIYYTRGADTSKETAETMLRAME